MLSFTRKRKELGSYLVMLMVVGVASIPISREVKHVSTKMCRTPHTCSACGDPDFIFTFIFIFMSLLVRLQHTDKVKQ